MTEEKMRELSKAFKVIEDYDLECEVMIPAFELVRNNMLVRNNIVIFGPDNSSKPSEWDEERL